MKVTQEIQLIGTKQAVAAATVALKQTLVEHLPVKEVLRPYSRLLMWTPLFSRLFLKTLSSGQSLASF